MLSDTEHGRSLRLVYYCLTLEQGEECQRDTFNFLQCPQHMQEYFTLTTYPAHTSEENYFNSAAFQM